jgi:hypothetical protein
VRGSIEWDDRGAGPRALLVVDGKRNTWDQLGRMLISIQVKLEVFDKSEER